MRIQNILKATTVALGVTFSPTLFAASYTWSFGGSGSGSSFTFNSDQAGGPTVKATAWYLGLFSNEFTAGTLGRFSQGLGVCNGLENCSNNPNHQVDNDGLEEFILFEFSTPVDPTTVKVTTTTSGGGDTDASYWLGGNAGQNLNLTGLSISNLAGLGFGAQINSDAANLGQGASRDIPIPPAGTFVNKMLFGARLGHDNDYFKITSMSGDTPTTTVSSVPEPSSVILLGTVALAALQVARKRARRA